MKLFLVQTGQSWTLKPGREYVIGTGSDCDIAFPTSESESIHQLKFGFDSLGSWYVEALGSTRAFIDNQKTLTRALIKEQMQITLATDIALIATPEGTVPASSSPPSQSAGSYSTQVLSSLTPVKSQYPAGAQPPSSIYSSGNSAKTINLGFRWFKISSPDDGVGREWISYSLSQTYRVDRDKAHRACEKLYEHVLSKVNEGCLEDAKIVTYIYNKGADDRRKFIRISRDTVHGVRTTIFIRFLSYGDNLYLALNVYVLGDFAWIRFLVKALITAALFLFSWTLIPLIVIVLIWWKLVWRISYEGKLGLAFRQEFPGGMASDLFNIDDVKMFAKSTVKLIADAIYDVFKEEGLPLEALNSYIQQINNITNVNTAGGNIIDSAIGAANKVMKE